MNEAIFTTELKHSFEDQGFFFYKIPDTPVRPGPGGGFSLPKPFDAFTVVNGLHVSIEAKHCIGHGFNSAKELRDTQKIGLRNAAKSGGLSLVALCLTINRGDHRLFWFDYMNEILGMDFPTWNFRDLIRREDAIYRANNRYDLTPILKRIDAARLFI